ncbi:MAG TPA: PfkB family carbohydrate kinase [Devosiaceae bacterium]|jgi:sulfofructose kinase|nr:PfkB family carbohydrate kinase [Devosiaceae bacterium]
MPAVSPLVVCCGAATLDTIFKVDRLPSGPGKVLPSAAVQVAHGMASSAAATVARLGGRSLLLARVGADTVGEEIVRGLAVAGIDCRHVRRVPGAASPVCTVVVDDEGERLVLAHYDPALGDDPGWLPLELVETAGAVLVDVRWPAGAAEVLGAARRAGIPAVLDLDTGPRPALEMLLPLATHVIASEPAARFLTGAADAMAATAALAWLHEGFVAVTAGAEGCWFFDRSLDQAIHVAAPRVAAVDTLAAGDVFHGAFVLGLVEGEPPARALRFASVAAALKCRSFGGRLGTPTRAEVDDWLRSERW